MRIHDKIARLQNWWGRMLIWVHLRREEITAPLPESAPPSSTEPEPVEQAPAPTVEPSTPPIVQRRPRARSSRRLTQIRPDAKTLADLLDDLDATFTSMRIPDMKRSRLSKTDVTAIHKLGIFVPTPWKVERLDDPTLPPETPMPLLCSALMSRPDQYPKHCLDLHGKPVDVIWPRFAFALKIAGIPPGVERIAGTAYEFGHCFELQGEEKPDPNGPARLFWIFAHIVVRPDGRLAVPSEYTPANATIHHRRGPQRHSTIHRHRWMTPEIFAPEPDIDRTATERQTHMLCIFRQLILWWNDRPNHWSVGVRRDDKRITFTIDRRHTAAYFENRERQVTENGITKKIIHYVAPHTRANGSPVRAHVRGLREFDWRGFHCAVVAPDLAGGVITHASLDPVDVEDCDRDDKTKYWTLEETADQLANIEDESVRPEWNTPDGFEHLVKKISHRREIHGNQ